MGYGLVFKPALRQRSKMSFWTSTLAFANFRGHAWATSVEAAMQAIHKP